MASIRILSRSDIRKIIDMPKAISLMEIAFGAISGNQVEVPVRTHIHMPEWNGESLYMPVYLKNEGLFGLKLVGMAGNNPPRGMPLIRATIFLVNAENGLPLSLMEGGFITALRTGAGSGLATSLLARKDAEVLAIFGTGAQAMPQVEAVSVVRDIKQVIVFGRNPGKAAEFAAEIKEQLGLPAITGTRPEMLREADIICTATKSSFPVFSDQHLKPGVHINGIGAYRPDMAEVPAETIVRSTVIVDQKEACLKEAGDILQPIHSGIWDESKIMGELGEIVAGKIPGRTSEEEITVFKSVGNAAQDLVVAGYVFTEAKQNGVGTDVDLEGS